MNYLSITHYFGGIFTILVQFGNKITKIGKFLKKYEGTHLYKFKKN